MFGLPADLRDPFQSPASIPLPRPEASPLDEAADVPDSSEPERRSRAFIDLAKRKTHVTAAREILSAALRASSGLLNARLAVDEADGTWIMDDQEVADIAGPIARIIVRRLPIPEGSDTSASDVTDAITAVVGCVSYGIRCLAERAEWRAHMRGRRPAPEPVDEPEPGPEPVTDTAATGPLGTLHMPYGVPMQAMPVS